MPLLNNSYTIVPYWSGQNYGQYDITAGVYLTSVTGTVAPGPLYVSTVGNNSGQFPSGQFIYPVASYSRSAGQVTVTFTPSGAGLTFYPGSLVTITGMADSSFNYTGMVINGSSATIQYTSAGPDISYTATQGAINFPNPSWTTGFCFLPSYASPAEIGQNVLNAKFGDNYSQRSPAGINPNLITWNLTFESRNDTEVAAMMAFTQNLAATYSTQILITPSKLWNNPNLKYVLSKPKMNPKSYNITDVTITATQVFEQ